MNFHPVFTSIPPSLPIRAHHGYCTLYESVASSILKSVSLGSIFHSVVSRCCQCVVLRALLLEAPDSEGRKDKRTEPGRRRGGGCVVTNYPVKLVFSRKSLGLKKDRKYIYFLIRCRNGICASFSSCLNCRQVQIGI